MIGLPFAHDRSPMQLASRVAVHTCVLTLFSSCREARTLRAHPVLALPNALGTLLAADSPRDDPPSWQALRAIYT